MVDFDREGVRDLEILNRTFLYICPKNKGPFLSVSPPELFFLNLNFLKGLEIQFRMDLIDGSPGSLMEKQTTFFHSKSTFYLSKELTGIENLLFLISIELFLKTSVLNICDLQNNIWRTRYLEVGILNDFRLRKLVFLGKHKSKTYHYGEHQSTY